MMHELVFAGFGGQGVLSMGQVVVYAGMAENREVCWMPSYGPEMRGGTANCTAIVSDAPISSPIIGRFDAAVILNQPSMNKFERTVKPGGMLFYESTNIINRPTRTDIAIIPVPASDAALKLNNIRVMNMIMLGALLGKRRIVGHDAIITALKKVLPERHHHLIPLNEQALRRGAELAGNGK